jgi:hypothetical protein
LFAKNLVLFWLTQKEKHPYRVPSIKLLLTE